MVFTIIVVAIVLLKTFGVVTSSISFSTSIYNVVSNIITTGFLLLALYQSFLALNILKQKTYYSQRWQNHFHRSGIFFCVASLTNLISMGGIYTDADATGKVFTSENFYVDVNSSSLMLFAIGTLLIFVSTLRLVDDNRYI